MKQEIKNPYPDNNCFFCGKENTKGLKLKFYWDEKKKETYTKYLPAKYFAGQGDILHGAIQMGLLDEIMGWTSYIFTQEMAVTSNINTSFLQPAYINGKKLEVTCRVTSETGAKIVMQATLKNSEGNICTEATGTYHLLSPGKFKNLIKSK